MDLATIFIILLIIFIILSCIELILNISSSTLVIDIPDKRVMINDQNLSDSIVITNSDSQSNILDEDLIKEHFISKLITPIEGFVLGIKESFQSSRPLSGIFEAFSHGEALLNTINPLTYNSSTTCSCRHSMKDKVETFIYRGKIYLKF
jgi:hypothetical protein